MSEPTQLLSPMCAGARCWELMYEVFKVSKPHMGLVAAACDLTPQQTFALKCLDDQRPIMMSELATNLGCDASNVTSIVDRLESRGLVERRSAEHDRRVKALLLTAEGVALRNRFNELMQQPPPALANLSSAEQETLCAILSHALASVGHSADYVESAAAR